jgi:hypothetical protein
MSSRPPSQSAGKDNRPELIAVDYQVGKFYLTEEDEIEAQDTTLALALRPQQRDGGWKKITTIQAVTMLMGINGKTEADKESRPEDYRPPLMR